MAFNPSDIRVPQSALSSPELNLKPIKKDFADADLDFKDQWRSLEDKRAEALNNRHSRSQQRDDSLKNQQNARLDRAQDAQKLETSREARSGARDGASSVNRHSNHANEKLAEAARAPNESRPSNKDIADRAPQSTQASELDSLDDQEKTSSAPEVSVDVVVENTDLAASIDEGLLVQPEIAINESSSKLDSQAPANLDMKDTAVPTALAASGQPAAVLDGSAGDAEEGLALVASLDGEPAAPLADAAGAKLDTALVAQNPAPPLSAAEKIAAQIKSELASRAQLQDSLSADMEVVEDELGEFELDGEFTSGELLKSKSSKGDSQVSANLQLLKNVETNKPLAELSMDKIVGKLDTAMLNSAYSEGANTSSDAARGAVTGFNHSFQLARDAAVQGRSAMQSTPGQAQWNAEVAEKVAWFSARNISTAEIRLDPPELGSLQIKIQLNSDQAQVTINSPHASVREALDQTSVRLREMFDQQGLDLVDVNVGSGGDGKRSQAEGGGNGGSDFSGEGEDDVPQVKLVQGKLSLVDSYA